MGRPLLTRYADLAGKVVLVTGAGRGIGRGIAFAFGAVGATVIINDQDAALAEDAAAAVRAAGGRGFAAVADVGERASAEAMIDEIVARHGRLDVLVNNAGINPTARFLDLSQETWERMQRTNLWGLFHCGQPAARQMVAQGGGSIVVIGSPACNETYTEQTHYAVAKAGLQMLAWGMAWELAEFGVRTNVVHPGWIETELNREYLWSDPQLKDRILAQIPIRRTGQPEDVARAVLWLCTDDAAYVNGASLNVDGGLVVGRVKV
ncbi:MAG TPA: SDR family NAD(P)-dependent oxidoreductase [Vicinamibacterales bacterium]|nr:SDR family NAD(P)-dependent oxidoreductase [Vicinamibacterales bacterium]